MKLLQSILTMLVFALFAVKSQAQITWNMTNASPSSTLPANISSASMVSAIGNPNNTVATNIAFNATTPTVATSYPLASAGNNAAIPSRLRAFSTVAGTTASTYIDFTITPAAGYAVQIDGIKWGSFSTTTNGPLNFSVRTSIDNFANNIATAASVANVWTLVAPATKPVVGAIGTAVTVRIYASHNATTANPAANTINWRLDDLTINAIVVSGNVGQIPKFGNNTETINSIITESATGNIGIGTTTPAAKLDVNGQIKISGGTPGVGKVLTSDANGLATWVAPTAGGSGTVTSVSVATANGFAGTVANATTTPAVTLSTSVNGLVKGNGTALSAAVAGTDYLTPTGSAAGLTGFPTLNQNTTGNAANVTGVVAIANGGTGATSATNALNNLLPAQATNANKFLRTDGAGVVTWQSLPASTNYWSANGNDISNNNTGNIGIGVVSPYAKFDVAGDLISRGRLSVGSTAFASGYDLNVNNNALIYGNLTGLTTISNNNYSVYSYIRFPEYNTIGWTFYTPNLGATAGLKRFEVGNGENIVNSTFTNSNLIISDGKVGIGITTPNTNTKLDVNGNIQSNGIIAIGPSINWASITGNVDPNLNYRLAVNGNAIFERAKVKLNTAWPDFVFDKKYNLPTLKEVEQFINTNKHLPGVPSENEIKKDGIDLGANQAVLLQKIEELTLYIIEQNKKIEALQTEKEALIKLQTQIDELKKLLVSQINK
jgi:hypothetical protein